MRLVIAGILCAAFATFTAPARASSLLYVADQAGNSVLPLDTSTQSYRTPIVVGSHPLRPVASPDGSRVYVQSADDASIAVIDTASAAVVAHIAVTPPPSTAPVTAALLSISPDGSRLYVLANGTPQITIVDAHSNSVLAAILGPAGMTDPGQARVSPDGKRLFVSYQAERTIAVIDTATGALQAQVKVPGPEIAGISALAFSPDGSRLYVGGYENALHTFDAASLQLITTDPIVGTPNAIAVAPDSSAVYLSTDLNCLAIRDLVKHITWSTGTLAHGCSDVAMSFDGRTVYAVDHDQQNKPFLTAFDVASKLLDAVYVFGASAPVFSAQSLSNNAIHPVAGLWWNPQESGRGYTIDVQDGALVLIASVYDTNGAPKWFFAAGAYDPVESVYRGTLDATANGPCLGCAYRLPSYLAGAGGQIVLQFNSPTSANLYYAGGVTAIQKEVW